jgi:hypothetical protein
MTAQASYEPLPFTNDDVVSCRSCGCTEQYACPGGCWWVPDPDGLGDICSACVPLVEVFMEPHDA